MEMLLGRLLLTSCILLSRNNVSFVQSIGNFGTDEGTEENHNVTHLLGDDCHRPCMENDSRVCYFKFVLEYYHAMGP